MKKSLKVFLSILVVIALAIVVTIFIKSSGKAVPIENENGESISVIEKIKIGGIDQYLIIRGNDINKPVLFFVHGGPGFSGYHFINDSDNNLEEEFILAYWEQRGAGKSFSEDIPVSSMTLEQFVSDANEVTQYLRKRFKQKKVYILGHSWGTAIATLAVKQNPELYHAYLAISQMSNQYRSEQISLQWLKEEAKKRGEKDDLKQLNALTFPDSMASGKTWLDYMNVQRLLVGKYGGSMAAGKALKFAPIYYDIIFKLPEYTVKEKWNFTKGNVFGLTHLQDDAIQSNFMTNIDSLAIPVHFFHGKHDHLIEYEVAKMYFDKLKAPAKHFYSFEHSAHRPFADETEKFNTIIREIVATGK